MTDLSPVLVSPPKGKDYFDEAVRQLEAGIKTWDAARESLKQRLGGFFYDAAVNVTKQQYKALMKTAVDGFNVGEATITRYRTLYQQRNELDPPTPQSREQQKRSIEQAVSARARANSQTSTVPSVDSGQSDEDRENPSPPSSSPAATQEVEPDGVTLGSPFSSGSTPSPGSAAGGNEGRAGQRPPAGPVPLPSPSMAEYEEALSIICRAPDIYAVNANQVLVVKARQKRAVAPKRQPMHTHYISENFCNECAAEGLYD